MHSSPSLSLSLFSSLANDMHCCSLLFISSYLFCKLYRRTVCASLRGKVRYLFRTHFNEIDRIKKGRFFLISRGAAAGPATLEISRFRKNVKPEVSLDTEKNYVKKFNEISLMCIREKITYHFIYIYITDFDNPCANRNLKIIIGVVYSMIIQSLRLFKLIMK